MNCWVISTVMRRAFGPSPSPRQARERRPGMHSDSACARRRLKRVIAGFTGADPKRLFQIQHKNLAVADPSGAAAFGDGLDHVIHPAIRHRDLQLEFWQERYLI